MRVQDALNSSGIDMLDAEILLGYVIGLNRAELMTRNDQALTSDQIAQWEEVLKRRKNHEPVAYIIGAKEFYGRQFTVTPATLIPRPSTEVLVEHALTLIRDGTETSIEADAGIAVVTKALRPFDGSWNTAMIVDGGCGSGCVGITLALELPGRALTMIDLSSTAIDVARKNAIALRVSNPMRWIVGDVTATIASINQPFILVTNPPYIPNTEQLMTDVKDFEPHMALFAGEDGLQVIRPMMEAAHANRHCLGIALECRTDQLTTVH